ncbi:MULTISPECIES: Fic family protein [unclassified Bartonella]|uniref:Fic/DOC family protein n=1 Tax=unclassified Bartonella TaxID=2645622 RepID=UPI00099A622E|nr:MULTISPECIES: Fic family protein [unclassified Bartonella]AQX22355.1 Fic/DOC family protein [Bartonella sp. 11B]AQX24362.1 Fic/DOC family protein [Bartonella sp. 114]AQX24802.1 Fic/DOC family protein [Bartonella sp. Coyote22sub2]
MKEDISVSFHNYNYQNSFTLKNKYRVKRYETFEMICIHNVIQAIVNLYYEPLPKQFDSSYLKHIHMCLYRKTFEWAGHTRDVPFMFLDGTIACQPKVKKVISNTFFAIGEEIQTGFKEFDKMLVEKNNLRGLSHEKFAIETAEMFSFLNYICPFKKGNGYTQRFFFQRLAQNAGYTLDFSKITEDEMLNACISALRDNDLKPMHSIFKKITYLECRLRITSDRRRLKHLGYNTHPYMR